MKNLFKTFVFLFLLQTWQAQSLKIETLLKDKISIRALEIDDDKVWYSGTDSKFGFVDLMNIKDQKQLILSDKKFQFRTLAQDKKAFYAISIESPAYFFRIDKKTLLSEIVKIDSAKNAFYDALHFVDSHNAFTFSDPEEDLNLKLLKLLPKENSFNINLFPSVKMNKGEAAFAASNTNITSSKEWLWLATGGISSRIFRFNLKSHKTEVFETSFIQGTASTGMYSIDFYKDQFGIAVGGDYTKQAENINNIATSVDAGKTWQVQASGKNAGYMTCVKIRPGTKGKEIIAVGDQHISYSNDFGKSWTKISDEKNLYVCDWVDKNTLVFAGKDRIVKAQFLK